MLPVGQSALLCLKDYSTSVCHPEEDIQGLTNVFVTALGDGVSISASISLVRSYPQDKFIPTDKFSNFLVGGHKELSPILQRSTVMSGLLGGIVYACENAENKIIAGAVWFGPGESISHRLAELEAAQLKPPCRHQPLN